MQEDQMKEGNKKAIQEMGRWLRVGFFTLTVIGPVISTVMARLRERAVAQREAFTGQPLLALKKHPYSQAALRRGQALKEELAERGSQISQELAERRKQAAREFSQRSEEMSRELAELGRGARQELTEHSKLWTVLGFGIGLILAGTGAYLLVRQRLWPQSAAQDEMIQLSQNGYLSKQAAKELPATGEEAEEPPDA